MKLPLSVSKILILLFTVSLTAQRPAKEQIGEIGIQPVLHGTLVLEYNGQTIYIDPYGGAQRFEGLASPDLVLITDIHGDHLNLETLSGIPLDNTMLVVPSAVAEKLPSDLQNRSTILNNSQSKSLKGISIEAVPMYNLPETEDSRHPKGRGNGYILTLGNKRVYISGDTEDISEMRALKNIDIAFICMNMPYTMTVEQAASAVNEFKPAVVYPYHYRGRPNMSDTEKFKDLVEENNTTTEVRLRNWYME